jgi:hypothetical protein
VNAKFSTQDLRRRWEAHRAASFPGAARGQNIHEVDFVLIDTRAAGAIETFVATGALDAGQIDALTGAIETLKKGMPVLAGAAAEYFAELLAIGRAVLVSVSHAPPAEFVVEGTFQGWDGRVYVLARVVDTALPLTVSAGASLGGCAVEEWLEAPHAVDADGRLRTDLFVFCLKRVADRMCLTIGDRVALE